MSIPKWEPDSRRYAAPINYTGVMAGHHPAAIYKSGQEFEPGIYHLFTGRYEYPTPAVREVGMDNYRGSFSTIGQAFEAADGLNFDWAHISVLRDERLRKFLVWACGRNSAGWSKVTESEAE
jgi:hypothetical protein